ncbi:YcbK family protein [Echinimonas agarilytica]|uniref:Murein endopeptidase K n=1 Tax=Echinimonas agarilytica TaxID=1215918 RepID=A0AA41W7N7_9GAMM|nr:YcbK family protein [Echinimonas agarilytica]MCM2680251.1 DUF882 domain-containing protein [Echinimonas agarilytica]
MSFTNLSRRRFMLGAGGAVLSGAFMFPAAALAAQTRKTNNQRSLAMSNIHTGESLKLTYFEDGEYIADSLNRYNHLLRDFRANESISMDYNVLDQVFLLSQLVGHKGTVNIISGYRSPKTNEQLRKNGKGVAKKSYHMKGQAIDVAFPGSSLASARKAAIAMGAGGVGYYPKSGFLHLDTGPTRNWG